MDDRTFDQQTALDWIAAIERPSQTVRDADIHPMLNEWIRRASPKTILDIGCGQGICSEKIDLTGREYVGIEPSAFLLNRAKELYSPENRTFLLGNAYSLPVPHGSFEAAFSILVWHLLSDPRKAAIELSRALKEDGHFLIVTANPAAFDAWKDFYKDAKVSGAKLEGTMQLGDALSHDVLYLYSLDEIRESLRGADLEVIKAESFRSAKNSAEHKLLIAIYGRKPS